MTYPTPHYPDAHLAAFLDAGGAAWARAATLSPDRSEHPATALLRSGAHRGALRRAWCAVPLAQRAGATQARAREYAVAVVDGVYYLPDGSPRSTVPLPELLRDAWRLAQVMAELGPTAAHAELAAPDAPATARRERRNGRQRAFRERHAARARRIMATLPIPAETAAERHAARAAARYGRTLVLTPERKAQAQRVYDAHCQRQRQRYATKMARAAMQDGDMVLAAKYRKAADAAEQAHARLVREARRAAREGNIDMSGEKL